MWLVGAAAVLLPFTMHSLFHVQFTNIKGAGDRGQERRGKA